MSGCNQGRSAGCPSCSQRWGQAARGLIKPPGLPGRQPRSPEETRPQPHSLSRPCLRMAALPLLAGPAAPTWPRASAVGEGGFGTTSPALFAASRSLWHCPDARGRLW